MIDLIFNGLISIISGFITFIIISMIVGGILLLPFLIKGGWILGVIIYGSIVGMIIAIIADWGGKKNEHK